MDNKELCIPAYLNQAIVFDLLAIIEDGFSNIKAIKSTNSNSTQNNSEIEAKAETELGMKNIFSLLSIGLRGKFDHNSGKDEGKEEAYEKVYTPASLFWKLRKYLIENDLLIHLETVEDKSTIKIGSFIEFEAVFHKNPIIENIENIQRFVDIIKVFSPETLGPPASSHPGGGKTSKNKEIKQPAIVEQIDALFKALTLNDSMDLLASAESEIKFIVTSDQNYFINGNVNRVIDGRYKILGKINNYIKEDGESISLLRTTSFNRLKRELFEQMFSGFSGISDAGIALPEIITEVTSPCIQIVPIAIYI